MCDKTFSEGDVFINRINGSKLVCVFPESELLEPGTSNDSVQDIVWFQDDSGKYFKCNLETAQKMPFDKVDAQRKTKHTLGSLKEQFVTDWYGGNEKDYFEECRKNGFDVLSQYRRYIFGLLRDGEISSDEFSQLVFGKHDTSNETLHNLQTTAVV